MIIKSILAFFQMLVKILGTDSVVFRKFCFSRWTETVGPVNWKPVGLTATQDGIVSF